MVGQEGGWASIPDKGDSTGKAPWWEGAWDVLGSGEMV